MEQNFLTQAELLKRLMICRTTLWKWRNLGMPYIKIGNIIKYDLAEVNKWIKERTISTSTK